MPTMDSGQYTLALCPSSGFDIACSMPSARGTDSISRYVYAPNVSPKANEQQGVEYIEGHKELDEAVEEIVNSVEISLYE